MLFFFLIKTFYDPFLFCLTCCMWHSPSSTPSPFLLLPKAPVLSLWRFIKRVWWGGTDFYSCASEGVFTPANGRKNACTQNAADLSLRLLNHKGHKPARRAGGQTSAVRKNLFCWCWCFTSTISTTVGAFWVLQNKKVQQYRNLQIS